MIIKEACVGNFSDVKKMINLGANRIELNADLAEGGTTPSLGTIKESIQIAHHYNVPIIVMLRPRGGDFVYSNDEFNIMKDDLHVIALLGADGIATGCLTSNHELDYIKMKSLINNAHDSNLEVVMHMAFDAINLNNQKITIDWLIKHHVKRILTHGGSLKDPIEYNFNHLKKLIEYTKGKIEVLPGGGVNTNNEKKVINELKVNQVHGTKIV